MLCSTIVHLEAHQLLITCGFSKCALVHSILIRGTNDSHSQIYWTEQREYTIKDSNLTSELKSSCPSYRIFPFSKYCSDSSNNVCALFHMSTACPGFRAIASRPAEFKYRASIPFNRIRHPTTRAWAERTGGRG